MKKIIFKTVLIILLIAGVSSANYSTDIVVTSPNGLWTDSRAYESLNAAVAAIGSKVRTLVIPSEHIVTDLTIPDNITLKFSRDGSITNSGTLTINTKKIIAPDRQIFTGTGDIDFTSGTIVHSSWFSDITEAINQTNGFYDYLTLLVTGDQEEYTITEDVAIGDKTILKWESSRNRISVSAGFTLSNIKRIEAGDYQIFAGDGDFDFLDGTKILVPWCKTLSRALDWVESEEVTLTVTESIDLISNETIDENITLKVNRGAIIGGAFTISFSNSAGLEAGNYQIFTSDITTSGLDITHERWFGAVIDGTTDDYDALEDSITQRSLQNENILNIDGTLTLSKPYSVDFPRFNIDQQALISATLNFYQTSTTDIDRPIVSNIHGSSPFNPTPGAGEGNSEFFMRFRGVTRPIAVLNFIDSSALGIQSIFGDSSMADRSGKQFLFALNHFYDIQQIAIEMNCAQNGVAVGNIIDGNNRGNSGNSHSFRLSGRDSTYYAEDNLVARSTACVVSSSTTSGMKDAVSIQNTVQAASILGIAATDVDYGVLTVKGTAAENYASNNYVQITMKDVGHVIANDTTSHTVFELNAIDVTESDPAIDEASDATALGANFYRGIIRNCAGNGASLSYPYNQLQLTIDNAVNQGVLISASSTNNTGSIVALNCGNTGVNVGSDHNNLNLNVNDSSGTYSIIVTGSKNVIQATADDDIIIDGDYNTINATSDGTIFISGDYNIISAYAAVKVDITGSNNVLNITSADDVRVTGNTNIVTVNAIDVVTLTVTSTSNRIIGVYGSLVDSGTTNDVL